MRGPLPASSTRLEGGDRAPPGERRATCQPAPAPLGRETGACDSGVNAFARMRSSALMPTRRPLRTNLSGLDVPLPARSDHWFVGWSGSPAMGGLVRQRAYLLSVRRRSHDRVVGRRGATPLAGHDARLPRWATTGQQGHALPGGSADRGTRSWRVMRHAASDRHGYRLRAMIVVLWRAGLRLQEALALTEHDLDQRRGSLLVRRGQGGRRREVGMYERGWEQPRPWLAARAAAAAARTAVLHHRRAHPRPGPVGGRGTHRVPADCHPRRCQAPVRAAPAAPANCSGINS